MPPSASTLATNALQALNPSRHLQSFSPRSTQALSALVLGLIAISFAPILIRLSETEITPYATIFHRSWMATLIFLGLGVLTRSSPSPLDIRTQGDPEPNWRSIWHSTGFLLALLGTTFTVAVVSWAWALTQTTIANSTLLHSFTPLFTGLLAWTFWGKTFKRAFWIGMTIAVGGAGVLGLQDFSLSPDHLWGDAISLFSALFFSVDPLLVEQLRRRVSTNTIMLGCFAVVTILTFPFVLLFNDYAMPVSLNGWLTLLLMAVVCQTVGHGLLTYCLKYIEAGIVSLSHLMVPLLSTVVAWRLFGEELKMWNMIAFVIILGGIVVSISDLDSEDLDPEPQPK